VARRAYAVAAAIYKAGLLKTAGATAAASGGIVSPPEIRKSKQVGGDEFSHGDNMPRGLSYKLPSYITAAYDNATGGGSELTGIPRSIVSWRDLLMRGVEVSVIPAQSEVAVLPNCWPVYLKRVADRSCTRRRGCSSANDAISAGASCQS